MERDVTGWLHKGETVPNLVAGLAYSIALNYLNRVVRGRKIGNVIYFQGGTAYNDAVTAAFASLLGKKITVPPYNGVMGAIGMALIARQWHQATRAPPASAATTCTSSTGHARLRLQGLLQPLRHEGVRHRGPEELLGRQVLRQVPQALGHRPQAGDRRPVRITAKKLLERLPASAKGQTAGFRVGLPRAMAHARPAAVLAHLFRRTGHRNRALAGDRSAHFRRRHRDGGGPALLSRAGGARPRAGAGGQRRRLHPDSQHGRRGVRQRRLRSHYCPWNQTLPWVLRSAPALEPHQHKFLIPTLHFQLGPVQVKKALAETMRRIGVTRRASDRAVDAAYAAQRAFQEQLLEAGRRALAVLDADRRTRPGAGRPRLQYLRPRRELRYPAQVAPPLRRQRHPAGFPGDRPRARRAIRATTCSGSRAARSSKPPAWPPRRPNLHLVYITNFKCGPDSYIKHFAREAAGAPLLVLQFDGHGNDAGYMTRCEAYLDSKGILRCYQPLTEPPWARSQPATIH